MVQVDQPRPVALPDPRIDLDADLTRLAQVFANLLTNSAKYTPAGGKIWLSAELQGDAVSVAVRDTGIGIPAASLPTISDMFSQVDRSIERSTGGLGIGLALVRGLTEMHGGTVTAASDGGGSVFTVTLPLLTDRPPARATIAAPVGNGAAHRVLVVDDNPDGAESLAMMPGFTGCEVAVVVELALFCSCYDESMWRLSPMNATNNVGGVGNTARDAAWGAALRTRRGSWAWITTRCGSTWA